MIIDNGSLLANFRDHQHIGWHTIRVQQICTVPRTPSSRFWASTSRPNFLITAQIDRLIEQSLSLVSTPVSAVGIPKPARYNRSLNKADRNRFHEFDPRAPHHVVRSTLVVDAVESPAWVRVQRPLPRGRVELVQRLSGKNKRLRGGRAIN